MRALRDWEGPHLDTKKCPHWIIILRRDDKSVATARAAALRLNGAA